jgi:hypothetical protein
MSQWTHSVRFHEEVAYDVESAARSLMILKSVRSSLLFRSNSVYG